MKDRSQMFLTKEERVDLMKAIMHDGYYRDLVKIAKGDCSEEFQRELLKFSHWEINQALARNPKVSQEILSEIEECECLAEPGRDILFNPSLELGKLLNFIGEFFQDEVGAFNGKDQESALQVIIKVGGGEICYIIARNWNVPSTILEALSKDRRPIVRLGVAMNPSLSDSLFHVLSKDDDRDVRSALAKNPSLPLSVQRIFVENDDPFAKIRLAGNRNTEQDILEQLSKEECRVTRCSVAKNPIASPEILRRLAEDEVDEIREAVAKNPNCPLPVLKDLIQDPSWWVRLALESNPIVPLDILKKIRKYKFYLKEIS